MKIENKIKDNFCLSMHQHAIITQLKKVQLKQLKVKVPLRAKKFSQLMTISIILMEVEVEVEEEVALINKIA